MSFFDEDPERVDSDFSETDDEELSAIRERRMAELKNQHRFQQNMRAKGHGELRLIEEGQFLKEVTSTDRCIVHFTHPEFERCKLMDQHLRILAPKHLETKFLRIEASKAPFFVQKLKIQVLPCVLLLWDGVARDRLVGFERLGNDDSFSTSQLENVLIHAEIIDDLSRQL
ncbi:hypothetical protein RCL1_000159 [Eukaryota sp. TZLM3-RCL]